LLQVDAVEVEEDPQTQGYAKLAEALIATAEDRPREALQDAQAVLDRADAVGIGHEMIVWAWPLAFRTALALNDNERAGQLVAFLDAHPPGHVPPLLRAERELAAARMTRTSNRADLDAGFGAAIAALRRFGSPFHLAQALLDYAERVTEAGDHAVAVTMVDEARRIAERIGAQPVLARVAAAELVQPSRSST
jgi:hypothetical protein